MVVSPPCGVPDAAFTQLDEHGPVRALIAPNAVHSMGLAPWKARYPQVPVFAPPQSIARLEKQSKVGGIRPVAEAAGLLGDRVEIVDMPHHKIGEVLVRWRTDGGWAWFLTDVALNFPQVPRGSSG